MSYRQSRNLEASIGDKITSQLTTDGWTGIRVEKDFVKAIKGELPCISIGVNSIDPIRLEIGSKTNLKYYEISIRIIATKDGLRIDLSDWILDLFEDDIDYYVYTITSGVVSAKVLSGKICIDEITRHEKELQNTDNLSQEDKYRNITVFRCHIAS